MHNPNSKFSRLSRVSRIYDRIDALEAYTSDILIDEHPEILQKIQRNTNSIRKIIQKSFDNIADNS